MKVLRLENLKKEFYKKRSLLKYDTIHAVNGVDFSIEERHNFGLVGESGCGKTTIARCILKLEQPTDGKIWFYQKEIGSLKNKEFQPYRKNIQMVFQDPTDSLNPRFSVHQTLQEPLDLHMKLSKNEKYRKLSEIMNIVGLRNEHLERYPHQLSAGQQQRVGISRAIICNPDLVILDEPTAALDVSVKGRILEMLLDLQNKFEISYMFISHDLSVIYFMCSRIGVMYLGKVVEIGSAREIFDSPLHPYTKALISALPRVHKQQKVKRNMLEGEVPSPIDLPSGCPFHTRCSEAVPKCSSEIPMPTEIMDDHIVSCHLVGDNS